MWQKFRKEVRESVEAALKELKLSAEVENYLEEPPEGFGELACTVALTLAKELRRAPRDVGKDMLDCIQAQKHDLVQRVELAGPGYLNFFINRPKFNQGVLEGILGDKEYGYSKAGKKKVLVEHTSANPDGPLHIGHGRNSILGDAVARLLKAIGYNVATEFYVNDCGRQMAVSTWGYWKMKSKPKGKKDFWVGDIYIKANKMLEKKPADAELTQILLDYEKGKASVCKDFKLLVKACLEGHKETLERLGIKINKFTWESDFLKDGSVEKMVKKIEESKYAIKDGKMLAVDMKEFGLDKELMVRRSDGTTLYAARDLAYHNDKYKRAQWIIDVLGSDHKLHFQHIKNTLKVLGYPTDTMDVIHYEFINLPEGQMSTRRGTFVALDELISETYKRALLEVAKRRKDVPKAEQEKIAEAVTIGAIRYSIISVSPEKPMFFNWEEALNFERSSAPAFQYTYARTSRILEKATAKPTTEMKEATADEQRLILLLSKFPNRVLTAATVLQPHLLAAYLADLNMAFKAFYTNCQVIGSPTEGPRLSIVKATRQVMGTALDILGIEKLERM